MPGQRAQGVRMRGIPIHDDLWAAVKARAARDGISRTKAFQVVMQAYADGRLTLPEVGKEDITPTPR